MKNIFYLFIAGLAFLLACGSENDQKSEAKNDNAIVEVGPADNSGQISNGTSNDATEQQHVSLDSKFAGFLDNFQKVSLPYKIEPEEKLDYKKIPFELQVEYLLKAEGLDKSELDQMQNYAKFFYLSKPISSPKFNAIIYARSEMGSSYYILCTFDNSGKLISFIDFAMHQMIGAGPQAGQEYSMTGSIDKNMIATTVSDQETKKYQIEEDGKIVKK
jgi:hypothetical protein